MSEMSNRLRTDTGCLTESTLPIYCSLGMLFEDATTDANPLVIRKD